MEQNKWQLLKHETDNDYVYEITNGPISLCVSEDEMPGDGYGEDKPLLMRVVDALNNSCIPFHSENKLELDQHLAIMEHKYEIETLQAKCDRLEGVLMEIENDSTQWFGHLKKPKDNPIAIRCREALSGDGEKETPKQWWEGRAIEDMPKYVKVIREDCANETGLYCKVHKWSPIDNVLPELKGQLGAELEGYKPLYLARTEFNFPGQLYGRLNACHLLPATEADYNAYLTTNLLMK